VLRMLRRFHRPFALLPGQATNWVAGIW